MILDAPQDGEDESKLPPSSPECPVLINPDSMRVSLETSVLRVNTFFFKFLFQEVLL